MPELEDYVLGTDFGIYHGESGTLIAAATDNQMQETVNMIAVSNKQSGKANQYVPGREDGSASGTGRIVGGNYAAVRALKGQHVTIKYSSEVASSTYWEVEALLSEISRQDPDDDAASFSYTFQFTSEVEEKTVPA